MLARQRQTIRKGRFRLLVPSGGQNRNLSVSLALAGKDCVQRKQSQNYRRGARDCQIAPLTLLLHAQMFPRFFKCDFQSPACHKPVNDLLGGSLRVGAGKDFVTQLSLVVARDHITNRHWWVPHPVPQGGSRKDQHLFLFAAVPINVMFFPSSVFAPCPSLRRTLPRAFERLRPATVLGFLCRGMMQSSIPMKAHHQGGILQQCAGQSQFDRGVSPVNHQDLRPFRHPAMRQSNHGHQYIDGCLVLPRRLAPRYKLLFDDCLGARFPHLALAGATANAITRDLRRLPFDPDRTQGGKKWQCPRPGGPRQFDYHRQRNPLQAEAFDGVFFTRSDRVSVAAQLSDLFSAPAFDRVVAGKDDGLLQHGGEDQNDQSEQDSGGVHCAPLRPIEHSMVVLKAPLMRETDDSQASCHGAFATSQQHAEQQRFCVLPSRLGKQGPKNYNQAQQIGRQCSHKEDFSWKRFLPELTRSAVTFSKSRLCPFCDFGASAGVTKWTKSSYKGTARTGGLLRAQSKTSLDAIRSEIRDTAESYKKDGILQIAMPTVIASAVKP